MALGSGKEFMTRMDESIDQLSSFLRGEIAAVETYHQVLAKLGKDHARYNDLVEGMVLHQECIQLLRDRVKALGGEPPEQSGAWGVVAKALEGGAALFGEKSAIAMLEEGEDHGVADYKRGLDKLDAESRRVVELQVMPKQKSAHDTVSRLKKTLH